MKNQNNQEPIIWIGAMTAFFMTDTLIKNWAEAHLSEKAVREVAGDHILLRKLHNYGIAGNLGEDHPEWIKGGTLLTWILLLCGYLKMLRQSVSSVAKLGGAMLLGGGLSNVSDRWTKGYVTDYFSLNVKWERLRTLVFNISDFFIFLGTFLVTVFSSVTHES